MESVLTFHVINIFSGEVEKVNNYKWDLVFSCSCEYINKELTQNHDKYIKNFKYQDSSFNVTGESLTLLNFKTPIKSAKIYINELNKNFAIDGAVTVIKADTTGTLKKNDPIGFVDALLRTALAKSLIQNQEQLAFVFASVLGVPSNKEWL